MYHSSFFFFFKQKTAYEMRISDWSSDVCSSDLLPVQLPDRLCAAGEPEEGGDLALYPAAAAAGADQGRDPPCRGRSSGGDLGHDEQRSRSGGDRCLVRGQLGRRAERSGVARTTRKSAETGRGGAGRVRVGGG